MHNKNAWIFDYMSRGIIHLNDEIIFLFARVHSYFGRQKMGGGWLTLDPTRSYFREQTGKGT